MHGCLTTHYNHTPNLSQIGLIAHTNLIAMSLVTLATPDQLTTHRRSLILIEQMTLSAHAVSTIWRPIPTLLSWTLRILFQSVSTVVFETTTILMNARTRVSLWNAPANLYYHMLTKIAPGLQLTTGNAI